MNRFLRTVFQDSYVASASSQLVFTEQQSCSAWVDLSLHAHIEFAEDSSILPVLYQLWDFLTINCFRRCFGVFISLHR